MKPSTLSYLSTITSSDLHKGLSEEELAALYRLFVNLNLHYTREEDQQLPKMIVGYPSYISDGPGYAGPLVFAVYGEPCYFSQCTITEVNGARCWISQCFNETGEAGRVIARISS